MDAEAPVTTRVPGIEDFHVYSEELWRFEGITAIHPESFWATNHTIQKVTLMAADYYEMEGGTAVLRVNDMSLSHGGVFDLNANWLAPHRAHRQGTSVDFNTTACVIDPSQPNAQCQAFRALPKPQFIELCVGNDGEPANETQHHCEFLR